jgi:hypothetical protein
VVEALREGVPLVTTGVGAQGLPGLARAACVVDEPARFAEEVCRLLTDAASWQDRCGAQIAYARKHFSEATLREGLLHALDLAPNVASDGPAADHGAPQWMRAMELSTLG